MTNSEYEDFSRLVIRMDLTMRETSILVQVFDAEKLPHERLIVLFEKLAESATGAIGVLKADMNVSESKPSFMDDVLKSLRGDTKDQANS